MCCAGWPASAQRAGAADRVKAPPSEPAKTAPGTSNFTISADVDLVLLDVSVKDPDGGFVSGLDKNAFTVLEDGKAQQITQFANQDVPVTLGLVVDNSGSMRPKKPDVITAGLVLVQASNPHDEVFVITFNDKVRRGLPDIVPFTDDVQLLRSALSKDDPEGRTSLYDAILAALHQLDMGRRDKKTLVVVSDGGDNASAHTLKEVIDAALASRATIYTIGVFDELDRDRNPGVLKELANLTGGVAYFPHKLSEIDDISRQIAKDIRTRYTIGFVPQRLEKSGERHIKVQVKSPTGEKLVARTRTSYTVESRVAESESDRSKPGDRK